MGNTLFKCVEEGIKKASKKYKTKPHNVTSSQFWSIKPDISEWDIRKCGGYLNIRETLFPSPDESDLQPRAKAQFKPKTPKLETFTTHELDIRKAFKELGLKKTDVLRCVVQPDTHVPEEDKKAISVFCNFLKDYKPHALINLGDFMEMGSVTHWENTADSKPRRLVPEAKKGRALLERIGKAAGPQCVIKRFIMGNHEDWLNQYLNSKIPEVMEELSDLGIELSIQNLLNLKELGYRVIPLNEILKIGRAHFIHGYYTGTHHASKHLSVFGCNLYYGHLHDVQCHSGVSVKGVHEAMSLGCLRTMNAPFLKGKPNNWQHAFMIIEFRHDGSYTRYVPIIVDGSFSYNGKVYSAE